jgi:hypothetical protein
MYRMTRFVVAPIAALAIALAFGALARAADEEAGGTISGSVVDKDGKAVVGAKIRVVAAGKKKDASGGTTSTPASPGDTSGGSATTKPKSEAIAEGKTDADGKFSLKDIPAGEYTVHANAKGQGTGKEKVSVKAGETADVKITIEPSTKSPRKPAK